MDDAAGPPGAPKRGQTFLLVAGSAGLLLAMGTDALAVLGRHAGFIVIGSIEVFQVAAVVALSAAILIASLQNRHARVDLVLGRVPPRPLHWLTQTGRLALVITFGLLTWGSAWVAADLWPTHEMTELLAIPLSPFRAVWILSCAVATLHFAIQFARGLRE